MNFKKLAIASLLLGVLGFGSALSAGTAGLTGVHSGTYNLTAARPVLGVLGKSYDSYKWSFDFDNGKVYIRDGKVQTNLGTIPYKFGGDKTIVDNGDGTYTMSYTFQPQSAFFGYPTFTFKTVLDITQTPNGLKITSVDSDSNGRDGAMATESSILFKVELNLFGYAD